MSGYAIETTNLGKQYYRRERGGSRYRTLRDSLSGGWRRSRVKEEDHFWALREVNLQIPQGEVVGVIGRNGAGKSTLLKVLSRITEPTTGSFTLRGRVASLLEVGTGFHPELTGRENIFLSGAVLGMRRHEIQRQFDAIVDFAGVEEFLDMPVKRYSSGMQVRLGFAVAAHLEAEILLVDEVLAVGDAEFQRKCLGKMGEVTKQGRTVLFVSHNLGAVRVLCKCSLMLEGGHCSDIVSSDEQIDKYLNNALIAPPRSTPNRKKGIGEVYFDSVKVNGRTFGRSPMQVRNQQPIVVTTSIRIMDSRPIQINIAIYAQNVRIFTIQDEERASPIQGNVVTSRFTIPANTLRPGHFALGCGGNINGVNGDWFWTKDYGFFEVMEDYGPDCHPLNFGIINPLGEGKRM